MTHTLSTDAARAAKVRVRRIALYIVGDAFKHDHEALAHSLRVCNDAARRGAQYDHCTAYLLHDVIEDSGYTGRTLLSMGVPENIVHIVNGMTDVYTPEYDPANNRAGRKALERQRLGWCDRAVRFGKAVDRLDNLTRLWDGKDASPGFRMLYAAESLLLLDAIRHDLPAKLVQEVADAARAMQDEARR